MSDTIPDPTCWPALRYDDAPAAIAFLGEAFGFSPALVVEGTGGVIEHAQLHFPEGGGVMLGSTQRNDSVLAELPGGVGSVYTVTADPDALFARARAAGATVVAEPTDQPYGSRDFTVRDPEGVFWSFGTYRGEPIPD